MKEMDMVYGITLQIEAKGPGIYISGHNVEGAINILSKHGDIYEEMKWKAMEILKSAQECNAILREIRSDREKGKLNISFEFESWENFLGFREKMKELSH